MSTSYQPTSCVSTPVIPPILLYCLFTDNIQHATDAENYAGALFIDLTKVFDWINPNIFLTKLAAIGVVRPALPDGWNAALDKSLYTNYPNNWAAYPLSLV